MADRAFDRTKSLIGEDGFNKLVNARVLVIGLGGVGGAAAEALARSGVGTLGLVDGDKFEETNLNRQILCTVSDIGKSKAQVAAQRVLSVNPSANVVAISEYVSQGNIQRILSARYDYCVDAIDDVRNKVVAICACKAVGIPIVSAMGAGNRTECDFVVTDIYKTKNDPLARKLRQELKKAGVQDLDVVCAVGAPAVKCATPVSIAPPPMIMGAMLAMHALKKLIH